MLERFGRSDGCICSVAHDAFYRIATGSVFVCLRADIKLSAFYLYQPFAISAFTAVDAGLGVGRNAEYRDYRERRSGNPSLLAGRPASPG